MITDVTEVERKTITIPLHDDMEAVFSLNVTVPWVCLCCGKPRGEVYKTNRYGGQIWISHVDTWDNPCGHEEAFQMVRDDIEEKYKENTIYAIYEHTLLEERTEELERFLQQATFSQAKHVLMWVEERHGFSIPIEAPYEEIE